MSADIKWTVVVDDLPKIAARMSGIASRIVAKTALDIEANAKQRVAVDTGALKNSIRATRLNSQAWRVVVGQEYGAYVEFGTVHMGPRPYFNPAINKVVPEFRKAWKALTKL